MDGTATDNVGDQVAGLPALQPAQKSIYNGSDIDLRSSVEAMTISQSKSLRTTLRADQYLRAARPFRDIVTSRFVLRESSLPNQGGLPVTGFCLEGEDRVASRRGNP